MKAFGGTVAAESELGRGSRFEVRLPMSAAPDPEPAEAGHDAAFA